MGALDLAFRRCCMVVVVAAMAAAVPAAQSTTATPSGQSDDRSSANKKTDPGPVVLTGCVAKGNGPREFTVTDEANGTYRVTGSGIDRYVGRRVEIAGKPDTSRLKIVGGLYPTPNVAAQAGSMDPVRAVIAAMPGGPAGGTGEVALPTFKVKSVRTLDGGCG
jgi:hypothetical protein